MTLLTEITILLSVFFAYRAGKYNKPADLSLFVIFEAALLIEAVTMIK